jgi:hypothetical protein
MSSKSRPPFFFWQVRQSYSRHGDVSLYSFPSPYLPPTLPMFACTCVFAFLFNRGATRHQPSPIKSKSCLSSLHFSCSFLSGATICMCILSGRPKKESIVMFPPSPLPLHQFPFLSLFPLCFSSLECGVKTSGNALVSILRGFRGSQMAELGKRQKILKGAGGKDSIHISPTPCSLPYILTRYSVFLFPCFFRFHGHLNFLSPFLLSCFRPASTVCSICF